MDVVLEEDLLTFKVIGGVLDLYVFLGPRPEDVVRQYSNIIGRPYFPPMWSLGYHQSRWGYRTIEEIEEVYRKFRENSIPLDAIWSDIE